MIHNFFERGAGAPGLLGKQPGNIVVEGKSGTHIMMIDLETS